MCRQCGRDLETVEIVDGTTETICVVCDVFDMDWDDRTGLSAA